MNNYRMGIATKEEQIRNLDPKHQKEALRVEKAALAELKKEAQLEAETR